MYSLGIPVNPVELFRSLLCELVTSGDEKKTHCFSIFTDFYSYMEVCPTNTITCLGTNHVNITWYF